MSMKKIGVDSLICKTRLTVTSLAMTLLSVLKMEANLIYTQIIILSVFSVLYICLKLFIYLSTNSFIHSFNTLVSLNISNSDVQKQPEHK